MHKVNSCIWDSSSVLTSDNYWTTQKFNKMNPNLPTFKDHIPPPKKVIIQRPPTPNYKDIQGEPREGLNRKQNQELKAWQKLHYKNAWDRKLYRKINIIIYKNKETLNHVMIFLSIVFGLKIIELNWNVIRMFCIENQNYFYLAWSLIAVLYINRGLKINQKNKQEQERINKWLEDNL